MARRRATSLSRELYLMSRAARDAEALISGDPKRIARRAKNRILGRLLSQMLRGLGVWR